MSVEEREDALAEQRSKYGNGLVDFVLNTPAVKLTLMPPKPEGEISQKVSDLVLMKMLPILSQNGISGISGNPIFALCVTMAKKDSKLTSSVPQKYVSSFEVNMYVANLAANEVYSSCTMSMTGAGDSIEASAINAMESIQNSTEVQSFLQQGKEKIINWFEHNFLDFKRSVERYVIEGRYDLAYSLLETVPVDAKVCHAYVMDNHERIAVAYREHIANEQFSGMKTAIASSSYDAYDPAVGAYLMMIPDSSPVRAKAEAMFDEYVSKINSVAEQKREHDYFMAESAERYKLLQVENEIKANEALKVKYESENVASPESGLLKTVINSVVSFGVERILNLMFI